MNREHFHDWAQLIIGLAIVAGCFSFLYGLYFSGVQVDPTLKDSLLQTTGAVFGIIGMVVGFYFGTSLSSMRKDITPKTPPSENPHV